MQTMHLGKTPLEVSRIALGCMRLSADRAEAMTSIKTALDAGITFFDHADIYGRGAREAMFAHIWDEVPGLRQRIVLQSKCGIRSAGDPEPDLPHRYDFSYEHIVRSVEGSLRRLRTDYLDVLLLHRPDVLMEPPEVARAFDELRRAGKVRYFGVSNHTGHQIALLQQALDQPLAANQLLLGLLHSELFELGVRLSSRPVMRNVRGDGTLEHCWLNGITVQAWSPLSGGAVTGNLPADPEPHVAETAQVVAEMAAARGVGKEAIAIGWLLRHPAGIQPIIGTMNPARIRACCQSTEVRMSREEWYRLFIASRGEDIP